MNKTIAIIGAGISGLTAGCALKKQYKATTIYERSENIEEFGAGVTLSPNATRLLGRLGVLKKIKKAGSLPKKIILREHSSGKEMVSLSINNPEMDSFITVDRRDLIKVLLSIFQDSGGVVETSREVSEIDLHNNKIKFSSSKEEAADLVIACDGIKSGIREKHFDSSSPIFSNFFAWRGIADKKYLPHLKGINEINVYYGPEAHVVHYPTGPEGKISFVGIRKSKIWAKESWKEEGSKEKFLKDFSGWNEELLKFMVSPKKIYKWGLFERLKSQNIQKKHIILMGDAAHPMVPFLGQGGCMAIEDAYTFQLLCLELDNQKKVLDLYEKIRLRRGNWIQTRSKLQAKFNHLSNPLLVKARKLFLGYMSLNSLKAVHSYDAHQETINALQKQA